MLLNQQKYSVPLGSVINPNAGVLYEVSFVFFSTWYLQLLICDVKVELDPTFLRPGLSKNNRLLWKTGVKETQMNTDEL